MTNERPEPRNPQRRGRTVQAKCGQSAWKFVVPVGQIKTVRYFPENDGEWLKAWKQKKDN